MHVNFSPDSVNWSDFLVIQSGGGAYFHGVPYQRGHGLGTMFGSVMRFLLPMLRSAGRELGKEGLAAGARILTDVAKGKPMRSAIVDETSEGLRQLVEKHNPQERLRELINRTQSRLQRGSGRKRAPARRRPPAQNKRRRLDALGTY